MAKPRSKKAVEAEPDISVVRPDQFLNTNDWPLYRRKDLFRVKQTGQGDYAVVDSKGGVQLLTHAELSESFEVVKGLHKGEF